MHRRSTRSRGRATRRTIRIGDPDRTITGAHTYTIQYRLRGVLNHFKDHDELYLNVVGNGFLVPIDRATASVTAPAAITGVACFTGPRESNLACSEASKSGRDRNVQPGQPRTRAPG